ncbi:MAG: tetratricopeptide repeat protein, partial [Helicobacteraceae bacterium]|nr:tetratricopeptide repeat protein [Helicobacteraceae bacterium]
IAIKEDPNNAVSYYSRGLTYDNLGDYRKAIADFTQAIKIDPNDIMAYNNRAGAYALQENYKKATQDAKKACELGDCQGLQYLGEKKLIRD